MRVSGRGRVCGDRGFTVLCGCVTSGPRPHIYLSPQSDPGHTQYGRHKPSTGVKRTVAVPIEHCELLVVESRACGVVGGKGRESGERGGGGIQTEGSAGLVEEDAAVRVGVNGDACRVTAKDQANGAGTCERRAPGSRDEKG